MGARVSWLEKVLKPDPEKIAASFGWLEKFLTPESDRAERRFVEQFAAYRWNGEALTQEAVRDISSTGLYVLTQERWQPGTILALTMQREGSLELDPARRITTQGKVVRNGTDGVGLTFLWSKDDPESRRWEALLESLIDQTKPERHAEPRKDGRGFRVSRSHLFGGRRRNRRVGSHQGEQPQGSERCVHRTQGGRSAWPRPRE